MNEHEHFCVPCSLSRANQFVVANHRHNGATGPGDLFAIGLLCGQQEVGVCIVGYPVAREFMDGLTLEVRRGCVLDGHKNANSQLYGAAWSAAKAIGAKRLVTYTLETESGSSLKATGWQRVGESFVRGYLEWGQYRGHESQKSLPTDHKIPPEGVGKLRWMIQSPDYEKLKFRLGLSGSKVFFAEQEKVVDMDAEGF